MMDKKEVLEIILRSAKKYKENLENKNILFIFENRICNANDILEVVCLPRHFKHLAGVDIKNPLIKSSKHFYKICLDNKLSIDDFDTKKDGTTELKMKVLEQLMSIQKISKMVTDYDFSKPKLHTEKLAGNITGCLGFVKEGNYYVPNTALYDDIRNVSNKPNRVLLILYKRTKDNLYSNISYKAKNVNIEELRLPKNILKLIDESLINRNIEREVAITINDEADDTIELNNYQ